MCVAAWALNQERNPQAARYWEFYKQRVAAGDKVILDNGAYEGQLVSDSEYIQMIEALKPTAYVVPDAIAEHKKSVNMMCSFPIITNSHMERIEVFQGELLSELEDFLRHNRSHWIAFPKWTNRHRISFVRTYYKAYAEKYPRTVHALGFIDDDPLSELPELAKLGVQSIDSSHPVWQSIKRDNNLGKFKNNVHCQGFLAVQHEINKALAEVFTLCGAKESTMIVQGFPPYELLKRPDREARRRYDLIPKVWLDELASIFEEGVREHGDKEFFVNFRDKTGTPAFFADCLNHAQDHLARYNDGDRTENQLAKVAWNVLARRWWDLQQSQVQQTQGEIGSNANECGRTGEDWKAPASPIKGLGLGGPGREGTR